MRIALHKYIKQKGLSFADFYEFIDKDRKGYINLREFESVIEAIGLKNLKLDEDIKPMYMSIDLDQDFRVSKQEFERFYDEKTILTLFPSILQFKNAMLDYVNTSGESGYYLVRRFDEDVDGELDEKEFTNLAKYLGCDRFGGEDNIPIIFRELDACGNGKISGSEIRSSLTSEIIDVVVLVERVKKQFMN